MFLLHRTCWKCNLLYSFCHLFRAWLSNRTLHESRDHENVLQSLQLERLHDFLLALGRSQWILFGQMTKWINFVSQEVYTNGQYDPMCTLSLLRRWFYGTTFCELPTFCELLDRKCCRHHLLNKQAWRPWQSNDERTEACILSFTGYVPTRFEQRPSHGI